MWKLHNWRSWSCSWSISSSFSPFNVTSSLPLQHEHKKEETKSETAVTYNYCFFILLLIDKNMTNLWMWLHELEKKQWTWSRSSVPSLDPIFCAGQYCNGGFCHVQKFKRQLRINPLLAFDALLWCPEVIWL